MNKRELGKKKEIEAMEYLKSKGFMILETNYYTSYGEIDIIAKEGEIFVFFEVKYRSSTRYGYPVEALDYRKRRHISMSALNYIREQHFKVEPSVRFDLILILGNEIKHVRNAFNLFE